MDDDLAACSSSRRVGPLAVVSRHVGRVVDDNAGRNARRLVTEETFLAGEHTLSSAKSPVSTGGFQKQVQQALSRYQDENLYRTDEVPTSLPGSQHHSHSHEADPGLEFLAAQLGNIQSQNGVLPGSQDSFAFPAEQFCRELADGQHTHQFSDHCLDFLLKLMAHYFPMYRPPGSKYLFNKVLGGESNLIRSLEYLCDECGHLVDGASRKCLRFSCPGDSDRPEFALNTGYGYLDLKTQVVNVFTSKFEL